MDLDLDKRPVIELARPALAAWLAKFLRPRIRLLVVVDEEIGLSTAPNDFGVGRMVQWMRGARVGCLGFSVDVGRRTAGAFRDLGSSAVPARYEGLRFDSVRSDSSRVIDGYDVIWCFGFKPHAAFVFPSNDAQIQQPASLPASDAELGVLTAWMNAGGGLFGTGDHDFLGSPMCSRIPRLGTMRAWTNAQGVPPIGGPGRLDTNRPFDAAERAGTDLIENDRESDSLPQPIEWVPWLSITHPWRRRWTLRRPHPVLCHPRLGPIDVMPDHPHEGVVFDQGPQPDVGLGAIQTGGHYAFPGVSGEDYPAVGSLRPLPMVIAHGRTLADPPYRHAKGRIAGKRFGMISVYDGHPIQLGRVATDSTWHHWFNMNLSDIESGDPVAWDKITRYWVNLAMWLAPRGRLRHCGHYHLMEAFYRYPGIEELGRGLPVIDAGRIVRESLLLHWGPCWVTQFTWDWIFELDPALYQRLLERFTTVPLGKSPGRREPRPLPDPIDPDLIEQALLGGIALRLADRLFEGAANVGESLARLEALEPQMLDALALEGLRTGLQTLQETVKTAQLEARKLLG